MSSMYSILIDTANYTTANTDIDLLELVPAANQLVIVHELLVGQVGSETSESLNMEIWYGYTVSGSGGAAITPQPLSQQFGAAGLTTVEVGNTTVANTGGAQMMAIPWNALNGIHYLPTPTNRIEITGSDRLVFYLPETVTSDLTLAGYAIIEVRGG